MVLRSARFAREISAIIFYNYCLNKICLRLTRIFEQSQKTTTQSHTGFAYAHQERGKPIKLLKVNQPQIDSSATSSSTLNKRSQIIYKLAENLSAPSTSMAQDDVIHQTANSVRRKPEQFISSFKEGGLNVIQSFTLKQVKPTAK